MQTKHIVAVVLAAACVLLISGLAFRNLNKASKTISGTKAHPSETVSWEVLMEKSAQAFELPLSVISADSVLITSRPNDTILIKRNLEFFVNNDYKVPAARYQLFLARASGKQYHWHKAGMSIYLTGLVENDSVVRDFLMTEAITCFDEVLKSDSNNLDATLYKALALADSRETIMQGVPLLLSVVRRDSNNIPANYTLAMLAIESGQLDKALSRLEKLISLQPLNPEYHFQAARVYEMSGKKDKALLEYKRSLELSEDPQTRDLIQELIENIN